MEEPSCSGNSKKSKASKASKKKKKLHNNDSKIEKKRKLKRKESFSIYIYKILKQVHPETGLSSKTMSILNSFLSDIFDRIAAEAARLVKYNNKTCLQARDIQTAVRFLIPGELAKHAVSEGSKALSKYLKSNETVIMVVSCFVGTTSAGASSLHDFPSKQTESMTPVDEYQFLDARNQGMKIEVVNATKF
ncbi:unnamed protein product [Orchesella dallaii]|uniref:Core Histone H2A/H2B/H3 domain-containing protein n=1 Tax=Orchesella dallaii TaxID=48710 RepID=A0ABP1RYX8_9HEXA